MTGGKLGSRSVCRNIDKGLPASHMIEIMFKLPPDFPLGGISNVPSILMKLAEQTPGAPLAGLTAKVTSGFFLFGVSAAESDVQRNRELLKERAWFDIPIVYNNGRRAVLAVQKASPENERSRKHSSPGAVKMNGRSKRAQIKLNMAAG